MSNKLSVDDKEPLVSILQSQVIPCWERIDRLVVTAKTWKQFKAQSLPQSMGVSVKNVWVKKSRHTVLQGAAGTESAKAMKDAQLRRYYPNGNGDDSSININLGV